ncbi:ACP S-malonyltransferase, partial [Clostridia bacterium OttesenSCG-928-F22]|nr:ACP S-malonyltransferase [Clostridia bacterium OttesenSCG-928-F22]
MQQASEETKGGMAAVIGKTEDEIRGILKELNLEGQVELVNFNCPGQIVLAGGEQALSLLQQHSKQARLRVMRLPVSGAFHSQAMRGVSEELEQYINELIFHSSSFALYSNVTALPYEEQSMKETLAMQTSRPVLFEQTIRNMQQAGVNAFIELGPGTALSGFVKRIDKEAQVVHVEDYDSYLATLQALGL